MALGPYNPGGGSFVLAGEVERRVQGSGIYCLLVLQTAGWKGSRSRDDRRGCLKVF